MKKLVKLFGKLLTIYLLFIAALSLSTVLYCVSLNKDRCETKVPIFGRLIVERNNHPPMRGEEKKDE